MKMYKVITPEDSITEIKKLSNQHQIHELLSNEKYGGDVDILNNISDFISNHYGSTYHVGKAFKKGAWSKDNSNSQPVSLARAKEMVTTAIMSL